MHNGSCRIVGALAILLILFLVAPVQADPLELRVVTYNIHHGAGIDGKLDIERIARVLRDVRPDIIALQEVDKKTKRVGGMDQPAELSKLLKMNVMFEKNIEFAGGEYGNAILTRFPILQHRNTHLPRFDESEQRGALLTEVKLPNNKVLPFICTHLDHRSDSKERIASAKRINELLAKLGDVPALLAGDLNATRDTVELQLFQKQWRITNPQPMFTVPVRNPTKQIDYVLCRPASAWRVVKVEVLTEAVASDHRAVLVVLELK